MQRGLVTLTLNPDSEKKVQLGRKGVLEEEEKILFQVGIPRIRYFDSVEIL